LALAHIARSVPRQNLTIEIEDLVLKQAILLDQWHHRSACHFSDPFIFASGDPIDQTREPLPADALCDAELGKMRSDRVAQPRAVPDQHDAGTMQDERALLLDGLDLREPHVGASDGFANRFGIRFVVLLRLHIGFHLRWWYEPNLIPHTLQEASPVMRRCARLDPDQAGLKFGKEGLDLRTAKFAAENLLSLSINAVSVKNVLRDIQPDCNRLHHLTFSICWP
jgi:hypothetical protein